MAEKRRIVIEFVDRFEFDIDLETTELGPAEPEVKYRLESLICDGEASALRQGRFGERLFDHDLQSFDIKMWSFCEKHPEQVVEGIWRGEDGAYCCRLCWQDTPYGRATMERLVEAKAHAALEQKKAS